ncbi:MAG: hypothetical protein H6574_17830 [Lewinellaceae bacterium]|nr:hypothetical protein [Saprospiraceae bacterium]MCB9332931.1 hypothetical protein [Lewinellaceae bacterium]
MHRTIVILLALFVASTLAAQQSNKSKSKDRYREKDMPSQVDVDAAIDQYGTLRALAEQHLRPTTLALSYAMLSNNTSAPVASRCFAYSMLAGYETTARYQSKVSSLHGMLRGMPIMLSFTPADSVFYPFAALYAILETGKNLLPSGYQLAQQQTALEQSFRQNGLREAFITHSKKAATDITQLVLDFARADGYARLASYPAYQAENTSGNWSASNAPAVEPYWAYLRPFILDGPQQIANPAPANYDLNPASPFRALTQEVYDISRTMVPEQYAVAYFWACDQTASSQPGGTRIPPAGRWMNIAGLVCEQQRVPMITALKVQTMLALTLADATIACWEEKYRVQRIRPQTAINQMIDANWRPVLNAPACPAGADLQSVVSAAAAEILSRTLGDNIPVADNTEAAFGVPTRQYPTIRLAAEEAAWSGLFGGISYRDDVLAGQQTGKKAAQLMLQRWPVGQ